MDDLFSHGNFEAKGQPLARAREQSLGPLDSPLLIGKYKEADVESLRNPKRQLSDKHITGEHKFLADNERNRSPELEKRKYANVELKEDKLIIGSRGNTSSSFIVNTEKRKGRGTKKVRSKRTNPLADGKDSLIEEGRGDSELSLDAKEYDESLVINEHNPSSNEDPASTDQEGKSLSWFYLVLMVIAGVITCSIVISAIIIFVSYSSALDSYNDLETQKANLEHNIEAINLNITDMNRMIATKNQEISLLTDYISKETETFNELIAIYERNKIKITGLALAQIGLKVGTGAGVTLAVGAAGFFAYEFFQAKALENSNSKLKEEIAHGNETLGNITRDYVHYKNYLKTSAIKVTSSEMFKGMVGNYTKHLLYSTTSGFDPVELSQIIKGKEMTVVSIITTKGWIVSGFLSRAWEENTYTTDSNASLLAVSRGEETVLPSENVAYAARLVHTDSDASIEFGKGDLTIYKNFTGRAKAGIIYKPVNASIDVDLFYANETNFALSSMTIHEYKWDS